MSIISKVMKTSGFTCPKCKGPAEVDSGYDTTVKCDKCGETKIIMKFLSNGDIETVTEDTNEYYELELSVREAIKAVEDAKTDDKKVDAMSLLSKKYAETGREIKAEKIASDVLEILQKNIGTMRSRYYNQIPVCATFAIARGDHNDAIEIYKKGLKVATNDKSIEVASMKVNYAILCTMKKDNVTAEKVFREAMQETEECFSKGEKGDDPYLLATIYDSLRTISIKNNKHDEAELYTKKALDERKRLLKDVSVSSARLIELVDSLGFVAESEMKKGNIDNANAYIEESIQITKGYDDHKDAYAYALLNRAKYNQTRTPEIPEGFLDDMNIVIPELEKIEQKDKKISENLAQAYMFRSMVREPSDYGNLLIDLRGAYENLYRLAQMGDVNEMFFMSAAHSYLTLLNMKDKEKARAVREELGMLGISQANLDKATRGTIGNVNSKKTKVDLLTSQAAKPIPGRRLRRQRKK